MHSVCVSIPLPKQKDKDWDGKKRMQRQTDCSRVCVSLFFKGGRKLVGILQKIDKQREEKRQINFLKKLII